MVYFGAARHLQLFLSRKGFDVVCNKYLSLFLPFAFDVLRFGSVFIFIFTLGASLVYILLGHYVADLVYSLFFWATTHPIETTGCHMIYLVDTEDCRGQIMSQHITPRMTPMLNQYFFQGFTNCRFQPVFHLYSSDFKHSATSVFFFGFSKDLLTISSRLPRVYF